MKNAIATYVPARNRPNAGGGMRCFEAASYADATRRIRSSAPGSALNTSEKGRPGAGSMVGVLLLVGILKEIGQILNVAGNEVLEKVKENKDDLIFEAEVFYEGLPAQTGDINVKKDVEELLRNLKEESLKEELAGKMRELNLAEQAGDKERSSQILKECQEINKKIHENKK